MCRYSITPLSISFAAVLSFSGVLLEIASGQIITATDFSGPNNPSTVTDELTFAGDVSNIDLLHGIQGTGGTWNANGSSPDGLNDGLAGGDFDDVGNPQALQGKAWAAPGDGTSFREFELGSGDNGYGFNITEIQSIASWQGAGFGNQRYEVRVRTLGETEFPVAPLTTVDFQPLPTDLVAGGSTKVNVTETTGILASGVVAIRFDMLDINAVDANNTVMAEIDVFGISISGPYVEVNQQTGEIKLVNPAISATNLDLRSYGMTSSAGALDPTSRITIAGTYDSNGNGLIDNNGTWVVDTNTNSSFGESFSFGNGDGGRLATGTEATLGVGAWVQNPVQDLVFNYEEPSFGSVLPLPIVYTGNDIPLGDLNFDGTVDESDWPLFRANNQADTSGLSQAEAYQLGDFNFDGRNSVSDFLIWRQAFIDANSVGAFEALTATQVPEPSSLVLFTMTAAVIGTRHRWNLLMRPTGEAH